MMKMRNWKPTRNGGCRNRSGSRSSTPFIPRIPPAPGTRSAPRWRNGAWIRSADSPALPVRSTGSAALIRKRNAVFPARVISEMIVNEKKEGDFWNLPFFCNIVWGRRNCDDPRAMYRPGRHSDTFWTLGSDELARAVVGESQRRHGMFNLSDDAARLSVIPA